MTDVRGMQRLVQEVTRRQAGPASVHVGDLAWWSREPAARRNVWREGDRVVAWAWDDECLVHPDHAALYDDVVEFTGASVWCSDLDRAKLELLVKRGYVRQPGPFFIHLSLELDGARPPELADGYRLDQARDVPARAVVQRAAFSGSTMTHEKYERLRATWPYREELDVVVEHADGYAAFALAWLDEANGIVELEPVGTDGAHARRGLARAAIVEALRRAWLAGAHTAVVSARGDDAYPVPLRLYRGLGFEPYGTRHAYRRTS